MGGGWVTPIMLTSELPLEGNPESPQNCLLVHLSVGNPESLAAKTVFHTCAKVSLVSTLVFLLKLDDSKKADVIKSAQGKKSKM